MNRILKRGKGRLRTGAHCADCGKHIKARNRKAQRVIIEHKDSLELRCEDCRRNGES